MAKDITREDVENMSVDELRAVIIEDVEKMSLKQAKTFYEWLSKVPFFKKHFQDGEPLSDAEQAEMNAYLDAGVKAAESGQLGV